LRVKKQALFDPRRRAGPHLKWPKTRKNLHARKKCDFLDFEHLRAADADLIPFKGGPILRLNKKHAKKLPTRFSETHAGDSPRKKEGKFSLFWD
jgi:hypothetical protein